VEIAAPKGERLRVFISYSRDDLAFADQLDAALRLHDFKVVIDRHGISGGEEWKRRLGSLIRDADTVVFVLSPSSANSEICGWEVDEALRLGKRIIPVLSRSLESSHPPSRLAEINYIYFYPDPKNPGSGFGTGLVALVTALNTDLDWLREHTRYLQRATEWSEGGRPTNRLLSGSDIQSAKDWAASRPKEAPAPTALHLDFIKASELWEGERQSEDRRRLEERERLVREAEDAQEERNAATRRVIHRTLVGLVAALLFAALAGGVSIFAFNQKRIAEQNSKLAEQNLQRAEGNLQAVKLVILSIYDNSTNPEEIAKTLTRVAVDYEGQGRLSDAEDIYQGSLRMYEKLFGSDHLSVATARENLGLFYRNQRNYDTAEPLLKSALQIKQEKLGSDHPAVAATLIQLAELYRLEGRSQDYEAVSKAALDAKRARIGEVKIFFGTNRALVSSGEPQISFGFQRSQQLLVGAAKISHILQREERNVDSEATDIARLAITGVEVQQAGRVIDSGRQLLGGAKIFKNQALVFVHGYNVSFESALRRAGQLTRDLNFDGPVFVFSWTGGDRAFTSYVANRDEAEFASEQLRQFLVTIVAETNVGRINFVAHSMGNLVLLRALERIVGQGELRAEIGEVIAAAPDVDRDRFVQLIRTIQAKAGSARFTLYATQSDWALRVSSFLTGRSRAGSGGEKPLIAAGVDTIDISGAGESLFGLNHDVYAASPIIVTDMRRLMEAGERPPDKRTKEFEAVRVEEGTYWRLRPALTAR
jgi:esterase/lipase superfamily enzyme